MAFLNSMQAQTSTQVDEAQQHLSSLISQVEMPTGGIGSELQKVKDVFPTYGQGFITSCMRHYNYNVEATIHHLLENSLPRHLAVMDRTMEK